MEQMNQAFLADERLGGLMRKYAIPCIISLFGGTVNEETFRNSKEYFFYISLGIPFYMFGQAMNPIIRADGSPKFAMVSTLAGAMVNIILDPLMIFGFRLGMMGAALATVIGQVVTALLAVRYLLHMKTLKLSMAEFRMNWRISGRMLLLGICSFLSQISLVAAMAAINNMLQRYGAKDAVFGVGFALLLPRFFGLDGVLYSMPVSDALTAVASAFVIAMTYRQLTKTEQPT